MFFQYGYFMTIFQNTRRTETDQTIDQVDKAFTRFGKLTRLKVGLPKRLGLPPTEPFKLCDGRTLKQQNMKKNQK